MVKMKRAEVFVEDSNVVSFNKADVGLEKKGCLAENNVYVAFSKNYSSAKNVIQVLETEFEKPENKKVLEKIKASYH